jgi:hypothetical protein
MKEVPVGQIKVEIKDREICPRCKKKGDLTVDGPCTECIKADLAEPFDRCFRGVRFEPFSSFDPPA